MGMLEVLKYSSKVLRVVRETAELAILGVLKAF